MKTICYLAAIALSINLVGCNQINLPSGIGGFSFQEFNNVILDPYNSSLIEVAPPQIIQKLSQNEARYQPQIKILSPRSGATLQETTVEVEFTVEDFPLFKNDRLGLGNHLHWILDNEPQGDIYDANESFVLRNLKPGTHTIRVLAEKPWHESFKNQGALAQVTFDVLTATEQNQPDPELPLLTYNQPTGAHTTEPILLDFYLSGIKDSPQDDWQLLAKINDDSFIINEWQATYLKGFQEGNNLIELELQDKEGNPVENAFNKTISLITFDNQSQSNEPLAQLMSDRLSYDEAVAITQIDYPDRVKPDKTEPEIEVVTNEPREIFKEDTDSAEELVIEENAKTTSETVEELLPETTVESVTDPSTLDNFKTEDTSEAQTPLETAEQAEIVEEESGKTTVPVETKIQKLISEQDNFKEKKPVRAKQPKLSNSDETTPKTTSISATAVSQEQVTSPVTVTKKSPLEATAKIPTPELTLEIDTAEAASVAKKTEEPIEVAKTLNLETPETAEPELTEPELTNPKGSGTPQPRQLKVPQWWKNLVDQVQNMIGKIRNLTTSA